MFAEKEKDQMTKLLDEVRAFIEEPSQNFKDKKLQLQKGVDSILSVLEKYPPDLIKIISGHAFIAATYLFSDLVVKMKMAGPEYVKKLEPLFVTYFAELIEHCVYNVFDLKRFIETDPVDLNHTMETLLTNTTLLKQLFENSGGPAVTLEEIGRHYPSYRDRFSVAYASYTTGYGR